MTKVNAQSAAGLETSEKTFVSELEMEEPIMPMRASNLKSIVMIGGALASQLMNNPFLGMDAAVYLAKGPTLFHQKIILIMIKELLNYG